MFSTEELLRTLQQATNQSNATLAAGVEQLKANTAETQALYQQSSQELQAVVSEAAKVAGDKAAIEHGKQKAMEGVQTLFNLDPSQLNNEIAVNLGKANDAAAAYKPVREEYDRLTQVSFFENPLGFLMAQMKLPQVAAQVNALADAEDRALQQIQTKTTLLGNVKNTVVANTADALFAANQSQAQLDARAANAKLMQADAENRVRIGASIMQQIQVADKINDNTRSQVQTIASIQTAEESRLARQEAREDRSIDRELRREQLRAVLDEKKAKAEEIEDMNDRLAAVSAALGRDPMTVTKLKLLRDKKEVQFWLDAADSGRFGPDVGSSVEFFLRKGSPENIQKSGASMQANATQMRDAAVKYVGPIQTAYKAANGKAMKDEEASKAAFDAYAREVVGAAVAPKSTTDMSSPVWDSTYNPNMAPIGAFSRFIDATPALAHLKNNTFKKQYDTLVAAKAANGDFATTTQQTQMIDALKWQILDKKITSQKAAADIAAFYKAATEYNFEMNKSDLFGIPKIDRYQFTIPEAGRINLFDPVEVDNAIQRSARLELARQMRINNPLYPSLSPQPKF